MGRYVRFTKEEKEEDIELVLEALKQGKTYREIAEDLGRTIQYIANIKKLLIERKLITQEEIDLFSKANYAVFALKEPVLQKLQEGKYMEEIAAELGVSSSTVSKIRDILIQEGLITLDEINKLNKKVSERETLKYKVLQGLKEGKLSSEISSELRIPRTTISRIKKQLISEGLISDNSKSQRRQSSSHIKSSSPENVDYSKLSEQEEQIINLLLKGFPVPYISKTLEIEQFDLSNIINNLKKGKYITSSQINEARNKFKQEEEDSILAFLRRGYSQADILQELTHFNRTNTL